MHSKHILILFVSNIFSLKRKGRGPSDLEPLSPLTFFVLFARFEKLFDEKHWYEQSGTQDEITNRRIAVINVRIPLSRPWDPSSSQIVRHLEPQAMKELAKS